jgi:hypothetical protein
MQHRAALASKALRGGQDTQPVGALNAQSGRALGVESVDSKRNEIPAGQTLLRRLELDGAALMEAVQAQVQTARLPELARRYWCIENALRSIQD